MNVLINEQRIECEAGLTVAALLSRLEQDNPGVALALNQQILPRTRWANHSLQEGDAILLFQVIAGG
ncbi:sulfur carrier protein ThiS [Pseudescherichia vulneris]|jgi:sulfur carrier protein